MKYYKVLAASQLYHGKEALTYQSEHDLKPGTVVGVTLKNKTVAGVVMGLTPKPAFESKSILGVLDLPPLPKQSLDLISWLSNYYPSPLGPIVNQFLPNGLNAKSAQDSPDPAKIAKVSGLPPLTKDQTKALNEIRSSKNSHSFLIHGDTGTGKTRVYIELINQQLKDGKSALVLTPEIGLSSQLVKQIESAVNGPVIVIHSNLTEKQRRKAWLQVLLAKDPLIVIGPRSALFAPFKNLGVIIMDEAHDTAYKQEQAPYYQAIRVAAKLASLHNSLFITGTATPNISDYYLATAKNTPVIRLQELAVKSSKSIKNISLIDAKDKSLFSKNHYLSDSLIEAIQANLNRQQQSLIFLNRRGTARQVLCQNCGWQALCPNCDLPLTFHGDSFSLQCHTCGYKTEGLASCPVCKSTDIIYKSAGTKAIVDSLAKLFPNARIQRFDSDSKKAERFESHYESVVTGNVDILVGTQILVKGLDLPRLGLVGVITADSSLSFPDYTAEERTFQLLNQIIGRIGRGHIPGSAIIQTYKPDSPAINDAIKNDWQNFYDNQLADRQKYLFPPFCFLLKLSCTRKSSDSAKQAADKLKQDLSAFRLKVQIIGPSPSFYAKSTKGFSWQLVVKSKDRSQLLEVIKRLPSGWNYDVDPDDLL